MFGKVRMIDLSTPLKHAAASEPAPAQIRYARHDGDGLRQMQHFLVLLHTGADKRLGSPDHFAQPGLGREGVLWMTEWG